MKSLDKQLSCIKDAADNSIFADLHVTEDLKKRVKRYTTQARANTVPIRKSLMHPWTKRIPVVVASLVTALLILSFWPTQTQNATALTFKSDNSADLFVLKTTDHEKPLPLNVEVDSFNQLYYRWSPNGRFLVYGNYGDLFIYDSSTEEIRNLTDTPDLWELMPSWSPDGEYITFTSRPLEPGENTPPHSNAKSWSMQGAFGGNPALIRRDGSGYTVLEKGLVQNPPSWSADGKTIAYGVEGGIHLFDFKEQKGTVLTPTDYGLKAQYLSSPSWSPVRNELVIYFSADDKEPTREEIMNGIASTPEQGYVLLDLDKKTSLILHQYKAPFVSRPPALWSSSGNKLALVFLPEHIIHDPTALLVMDRNGNNKQNLGEAYQAAWEPGGSRLAYIDLDNRRSIVLLSPTDKGWERQTVDFTKILQQNFLEGFAWRPGIKG
ncbi:TolB family protein [Desulfitobacterium hafniense]|uniref:TolB family protein n=1 Tax=Desulfitobacterium hafniense TaxID=49338 RepID=UPI00036E5E26|nr:PD40 domain-containing protein [Desulfitobacterium hafniense]